MSLLNVHDPNTITDLIKVLRNWINSAQDKGYWSALVNVACIQKYWPFSELHNSIQYYILLESWLHGHAL